MNLIDAPMTRLNEGLLWALLGLGTLGFLLTG